MASSPSDIALDGDLSLLKSKPLPNFGQKSLKKNILKGETPILEAAGTHYAESVWSLICARLVLV
jgi:hypothetical protein